MKVSQTLARVGGREGVRGGGDDGGDGQGELRPAGGRPRRLLRAAHRRGQGALRGKDVPRRKPHKGE